MSDYFLSCYSARPFVGFKSVNDEDIKCPLDHELLDSLCPVNIETGLRDDPLVRVNDPNISDSERQALLSALPKITPPKGDNVDDETKLMFVKMRSLQTPSELNAFKSSIQMWLDSQFPDGSGDGSGDGSSDGSGDGSGDRTGDGSGDRTGDGSGD